MRRELEAHLLGSDLGLPDDADPTAHLAALFEAAQAAAAAGGSPFGGPPPAVTAAAAAAAGVPLAPPPLGSSSPEGEAQALAGAADGHFASPIAQAQTPGSDLRMPPAAKHVAATPTTSPEHGGGGGGGGEFAFREREGMHIAVGSPLAAAAVPARMLLMGEVGGSDVMDVDASPHAPYGQAPPSGLQGPGQLQGSGAAQPSDSLQGAGPTVTAGTSALHANVSVEYRIYICSLSVCFYFTYRYPL